MNYRGIEADYQPLIWVIDEVLEWFDAGAFESATQFLRSQSSRCQRSFCSASEMLDHRFERCLLDQSRTLSGPFGRGLRRRGRLNLRTSANHSEVRSDGGCAGTPTDRTPNERSQSRLPPPPQQTTRFEASSRRFEPSSVRSTHSLRLGRTSSPLTGAVKLRGAELTDVRTFLRRRSQSATRATGFGPSFAA